MHWTTLNEITIRYWILYRTNFYVFDESQTYGCRREFINESEIQIKIPLNGYLVYVWVCEYPALIEILASWSLAFEVTNQDAVDF